MRSLPMFFLIALTSPVARGGLPEASPSDLGFDPARFGLVEDRVRKAVESHEIPGAVVLVARDGRIALRLAVGLRSVEPQAEPMTTDTIFDLASLTKPVSTATSILLLIEREKFRLDSRLADLLPEFSSKGKEAITVEQLLRHRSGLIADNPISDYRDGPDLAWKRLAELPLAHPPGSKFVYSDVGFEILSRIVDRHAPVPFDRFAEGEIFAPLGMNHTFFTVPRSVEVAGKPFLQPLHSLDRAPVDVSRFAPTERLDGSPLRGVVHDPRARALGGFSGHAGLFSTADDLALFCQMLLDSGRSLTGRQILSPSSVLAMTSPGTTHPGERRGLGWDIDTSYSSPRGLVFGPNSFGHTGFTGTSLWIDPSTRTFVILLTSRLHPDGKLPSPTPLRRDLATLVGQAIVGKARPQAK